MGYFLLPLPFLFTWSCYGISEVMYLIITFLVPFWKGFMKYPNWFCPINLCFPEFLSPNRSSVLFLPPLSNLQNYEMMSHVISLPFVLPPGPCMSRDYPFTRWRTALPLRHILGYEGTTFAFSVPSINLSDLSPWSDVSFQLGRRTVLGVTTTLVLTAHPIIKCRHTSRASLLMPTGFPVGKIWPMPTRCSEFNQTSA